MATKGQLKFLTALSILSKEDRFCDVRLELSDGQRDCNRLLLAAVSPFFNVMLSTDMLEGLSGLVKLPTVSTAIFDAILDYYVDGKGDLQDSAFYEAVNASEMMQLPEFKDVCLKNMEDNLSPKTSLRAWQISRKFAAENSLISKAFEMVLDNFELVSKDENFLALSRRDLTAILKHKGLNRPQEDHILEAVLRWIESNEPTEDEAHDLISNVRLDKVTPRCLINNTFDFKLAQKYGVVIEMMRKAGNSDELASENGTSTKDVVIVSSSSNNQMQVHAWDPMASRWYCLSRDTDINLTSFAATVADMKIIVSGGKNETALPKTYIYNTLTNVWHQGPTLNHARYDHSSVTVDNVAYVLGGRSGNNVFESVEELSPDQTTWSVAGNLWTPIYDAAVCTSGKYILIYGKDSDYSNAKFSIQCFNVDNNTSCLLQSGELTTDGSMIITRYCYLSYSCSLSVLYLDGKEIPSLVVHKREMHIPPIFGYCSYGVVGFNRVIFACSDSETKVIHFASADDDQTIIQTLPKIPPSLSSVWGAVKGRVAKRCLQTH